MTTADYTKHDARITSDFGVFGLTVKDRYGWECIQCGAKSHKFGTGALAKADAERHNGGPYNSGESPEWEVTR